MTHSQSLHANSGRNDSEESKAQLNTLQTGQWHFTIYIYIHLRPRGGRKLALQNGKVEGSEVGKNTALFLEAGVKSPLYVALCPDPPAREEREERRKDERQRGEREREEREMREIRKR